ncbi:NTF2-like protein [Rickenella mellea]|uniref:NTF2-like protein n=1 Tax=Rickenella mellea TaxID=50990 RepID=A0A4Y7QCT7_9AGAM|nr:NTF2-like protein [Rickenella mellea]
MFSSPTPLERRGASRNLATTTLKSAGLIDRDERMRDANDKPGGRKGPSKKTGHRNRAMEMYKDAAAGSSRNALTLSFKMRLQFDISKLASRISTLVDPVSIRGAASRPTTIGRLRRSAIQTTTTRDSSSRMKAVDVWREFVHKRYNAEKRFLNLERIADDDILKKHNIIPPGVPGNTSSREMSVIFKLAASLKPEVQTISLANNNFSSGLYLSGLPHYLPNLSNLSLQNNGLKTWRDIEQFSPRRGKALNLREIVLIGNPIRDLEIKNGRKDFYRSEMTRRFPSLEVLDQEAVAKISFAVPLSTSSSVTMQPPLATAFSLPMAPSFITGVEGSIISNFLTRFFTLFDNQRTSLASAYLPTSTFSYSAVTSIPHRARAQRLHTSSALPNQRKLEWPPWLSNKAGGSRNLTRMGGVEQTINRLHIGGENIVKAMQALPATVHDVSGNPEKFCIDAWPVGLGETMLLFISVHGEFAEAPSMGVRSFDRSFILAPAPEGSTAKLDNWDVAILSDQLIVRAYSSYEAWAPGPLKVQSSGTESGPKILPPEMQAALRAIPEPKQTMVFAIIQRTGLNLKFAVECLEGNGWDVERAVANFESVKTDLTPDAFL